MNDTQEPAMGAAATSKRHDGFTTAERAAIKDRVEEMRAAGRRRLPADKANPESEVLARIAEMQGSDRALAERIHALAKEAAPVLSPRLWYGMPAYAKDGKIVCFFQSAQKFKTRYATLGFNEAAALDDGNMWPVAFALKELTAGDERKIGELVRKAVS